MLTAMTRSHNPDRAARTVGELVAEDYRRAAVFKRFRIDFCCGGDAPLQAVCARKSLDVAEVLHALDAAEARGQAPQARVTAWAPGFLADYIVNEHHAYVRETLPVLRAFTLKVARVHSDRHPELVEIYRLFHEVAAELEEHLACEEQVVFPAIRALDETRRSGRVAGASLHETIRRMEADHDGAGETLRRIRALTNDYTPPPDACATYRATFVKLEEFEEDLHRHVHLENNVLFPKALALEAPETAGDGAPTPAPMPDHVLDVRVIPPPQKHPAIFTTFDALAPGESFILVNDHDPVPLRYQFEFTRSGQAGWEYLEQGPEVWRVRLSKSKEPEASPLPS